MNRRWILAGVTAAAALGWTGTSAAQEANGFGRQGQLILSADRLVPVFSHSNVSVTRTENNVTTTTSQSGSSTSLLFGRNVGVDTVHTIPRVAVDFTVIDRLTVGGALAFGFTLGGEVESEVGNVRRSIDTPSVTAIGLAPRVGYILPLGSVLAFWPRGGFAFYSVRTKVERDGNNGRETDIDSDSVFSLDLDPQLAIIPLPHFFFSFGPLVNIPLTGSRNSEAIRGATTTTRTDDLSVFQVGITASLGGWFDL